MAKNNTPVYTTEPMAKWCKELGYEPSETMKTFVNIAFGAGDITEMVNEACEDLQDNLEWYLWTHKITKRKILGWVREEKKKYRRTLIRSILENGCMLNKNDQMAQNMCKEAMKLVACKMWDNTHKYHSDEEYYSDKIMFISAYNLMMKIKYGKLYHILFQKGRVKIKEL